MGNSRCCHFRRIMTQSAKGVKKGPLLYLRYIILEYFEMMKIKISEFEKIYKKLLSIILDFSLEASGLRTSMEYPQNH